MERNAIIEVERVMNERHGAVEQTPTVAACASPPRDVLPPPPVAAPLPPPPPPPPPPLAVIKKRKCDASSANENLEPLAIRRIPELSRKTMRLYLSSMGASTHGDPAELKERLQKLFALNGIDQGDDDGTTAKWYHPGKTTVRIRKVPKYT